MAYIERDGGQIYYERYKGEKTPVFLIHGWGMSTGVWSAVTDRLVEAGHEVVLLDHRGCGKSDRDFDDMSVEAIAGDVAAIADTLGLRPCVLNGWSMGGAVAVEAASQMGDKAAGLFLTCPASPRLTSAPDFPYGGEPGSYDGLGEGINADRAGFFRGLAGSVCAKDPGQATLDWMERVFVDSSPRAWKSLAGAGNMDQRATLAALDIPVLVCVGDKDQVVSPALEEQAAVCAKHGEAVHFEESGHAPFIEEPEKYMETLKRFTESVR
jgi:non-heme chloroperoxidase